MFIWQGALAFALWTGQAGAGGRDVGCGRSPIQRVPGKARREST